MSTFLSSCRSHSVSDTEHPKCPALSLTLHPSLTPDLRCLYSSRLPYLPRVFSLLFRLQDANCGLRSLVRAMKTSWQGGKLFICSVLMGQHKAGSFPWAPLGPSKSTWAGGSNKQAGQLSCFSKAAPQSRPWPLAVWRLGLLGPGSEPP